MANWTNHDFLTPRRADNAIVLLTREIFEKLDISIQSAQFLLKFGPQFDAALETVLEQPMLKSVLHADGYLVSTFAFRFGQNQIFLTISRENEFRDRVQLQLQNLSSQPHLIAEEKLLELILAVKRGFKELDSHAGLDALGVQVREHYDRREASLTHLEGLTRQLVRDVAEASLRNQKDLDEALQRRRSALEEEFESLRDGLEVQYSQRFEKLNEQEDAVKARLAEIDDDEARHARRKIRADMKKELEKRATTFELTTGTRDMRKPILWFSLALLVAFALGFVLFSKELFDLFNASPPVAISPGTLTVLAIRQAAFAAAFGAIAVFFIRWNNRWLEQHATEEFKLKRLELDFDRASWVVEMAMEWKAEKGGAEIPAQLVERLTAHLFDATEEKHKDSPNIDRLSQLLGASAGATLKLPGGSSVKLDRKSIRDLEKEEPA